MTFVSKLRPLAAGLALVLALSACGGDHDSEDGHGHAEEGGEHAEGEEARTGEHGGRLLEQGEFAVELAIAEDGTPPKYQAWLYRDGKPVPGTEGTVQVNLKRLGNVAEQHALAPQDDGSLMAATVVGEPHSFDVEVRATIDGQSLRWTYPSYEGRTEIAAAVAAKSGIEVAPAGPGTIADEHEVQGLLTPVEGRVASVAARFPGPVRSLRANVGDAVRAGQPLATIESNLSLSTYTVSSPIAGVVTDRNGAVGGVAAENMPLFEIADLSQLWVDLHIFGSDAQHIRPGVPVTVTRLSDGETIETMLERVLPGTATASQSTVARATIDNSDGLWRPGSAVKARITVDREPVDLMVPLAAVQQFRDWDVVFVRVGDTYEIRPVELGKRDGERVQVLSGLDKGAQVVVEQSYLVKADIEKSGASHDH
ncbi:efflux RND transporter periplasmic adaptor subunit [Novilysobacter selenitireducens]|uniref:Efflux RND transporter periplasmic adaptor subunit n=1 Tax=Novilysobacter selenitireducens TaxID=2872639 RepID=A0ABS7T580_9GAMM|nr:efflux RND transporter periplasmic adaptor subunit [Lysobacter selenitireducens]MBZ4039039.1 efflux RND transporter periplasmic adaptor subunit [Lysobacter selenitireducens]OHE83328.1 MAG: efflux transporter periplasmic adaptor subunit [Xanthomonadales bacterium RIFOXYA1_FULL_69_10]